MERSSRLLGHVISPGQPEGFRRAALGYRLKFLVRFVNNAILRPTTTCSKYVKPEIRTYAYVARACRYITNIVTIHKFFSSLKFNCGHLCSARLFANLVAISTGTCFISSVYENLTLTSMDAILIWHKLRTRRSKFSGTWLASCRYAFRQSQTRDVTSYSVE